MFVEIGHITEDVIWPDSIIGGGVSYAGATARGYGYDVTILTKIPEGHPFINEFDGMGITVIGEGGRGGAMTVFVNEYDNSGGRTQRLVDRQAQITHEDVRSIEGTLAHASQILIAPVIGEVDTDVIPYLSRFAPVTVTPQGYFRATGTDGVVYQRDWDGFDQDLSHALVTVFSDEDISVRQVLNHGLLRRITAVSPVTVLTRGAAGSTVFVQDREPFDVPAFRLFPNEIRTLTGAGDCYAASFMAAFARTADPHAAAVEASLFAAMKIVRPGIGIKTVPDRAYIDAFILRHARRVAAYLDRCGVSGPVFG